MVLKMWLCYCLKKSWRPALVICLNLLLAMRLLSRILVKSVILAIWIPNKFSFKSTFLAMWLPGQFFIKSAILAMWLPSQFMVKSVVLAVGLLNQLSFSKTCIFALVKCTCNQESFHVFFIKLMVCSHLQKAWIIFTTG